MTSAELNHCIQNHPKNQAQIAKEIGVSSSGMSKWVNNLRKIDERDSKLLRLYFHGEQPFPDSVPDAMGSTP